MPLASQGEKNNSYLDRGAERQDMPVANEIRFTLNGKTVSLTSEQVRTVASKLTPQRVQAHGVEIDGRIFPVKQIFEAATGYDRSDFISTTARRHLKNLGFGVFRRSAN